MTSKRSESEQTTAKCRRFAFSGLEQRLQERWKRDGPAPGSTIVVAFSGGNDSLCLAAVMARVAPWFETDVRLLHVDHCLRPGSADEAKHARNLAAQLGLPIDVVALEPGLGTRHPGAGIEEAARRERYLALQRYAGDVGAWGVATAHHLDDQAETVLLHLLRGAGLSGAAGMAEIAELRIPWWGGGPPQSLRLWRPFLPEDKATLVASVRELGLRVIEDESNADQSLRRNAVRHSVLPILEAAVPGARTALARFADLAAEDDRLLDQLTEEAARGAVLDPSRLSIDVAAGLPRAIRRRLVARWLREALPAGAEVTANRVDAVIAFLAARHGGDKRIEVGGGAAVTKIGPELVIGVPAEIDELLWASFAGPRPTGEDRFPAALVPNEPLTFSRFRLMTVHRPTANASAWDGWARLPLLDLRADLVVRQIASGDRFVDGTAVGAWLARRGVPAQVRRQVVCVSSARGVHWVPGVDSPGANRSEIDESDGYILWNRRED